jgi:hypothetical protein
MSGINGVPPFSNQKAELSGLGGIKTQAQELDLSSWVSEGGLPSFWRTFRGQPVLGNGWRGSSR